MVPGDNNETTQFHSYPEPPNLPDKAEEVAEEEAQRVEPMHFHEDAHHELIETDNADTDSKKNIAEYLPNSTSISIRTQVRVALGFQTYAKQ